MITLITGGSKCGKSSLAERIICGFSGKKFYIATMKPYGDEAFQAIERHREMRKGKGFKTIEKYNNLSEITLPEKCVVLLECMGNLCANEMFVDGRIINPTEKIIRDIKYLDSIAEHLVIVTNEVGNDGISYEKGTEEYIACMGKINRKIAESAENVIECVYGIPVVLKGELCY